MKTTISRYFFGVALAVSIRAELLPNPSADAGSSSSLAVGDWFGLSVQDSGFLLTAGSGSSNLTSNSTDDQGFASYYAARSVDGQGNNQASTQLSSGGMYSSAFGGSAVNSASSMLAVISVSDILTETVSVTSSFASSRPVAMSPSLTGPAPQSAYSSAWQLSPQVSNSQLTTAAPDSVYAAQLVYGGGGSTQTSSQQPYSYLNQFASSYAWNAPSTNTTSSSSFSDGINPSTDSMFFGLMNAGLSMQTQTFFVPVTTNTVSGQALTSPSFIPTPVTQFGSEVPEPGTWALLASALAAVAARRKYSKS